MTNALQSLSDAMAAAVEAVSAGVVRVEARGRMPSTGVVWSADGLIVTSDHTVERTENIQIGLGGDTVIAATLVARDSSSDLAVLRAESALTPPAWADMADLKVGHLALALGRPGAHMQATLGVVSAIGEAEVIRRGGRRKRRAGAMLMSYIQTDVLMYPGFSGGPLVDAAGAVRGINTSGLSRGASITIPTDVIRGVVDALLAHGKVRRGYLGVGAQPVRLPAALAESLEQEVGLMLVSVEPDSPAEAGGLMLGDILVTLEDYPVQMVDELMLLLNSDRAGREVRLKIVRGGQLHELTLTVGERE